VASSPFDFTQPAGDDAHPIIEQDYIMRDSMKIIFQRGPLHGQTDTNVPEQCVVYRRRAHSPLSRYRITERINVVGYRVFDYWPPKPGEAEPSAGLYDA
jgi:hypothetical protein